MEDLKVTAVAIWHCLNKIEGRPVKIHRANICYCRWSAMRFWLNVKQSPQQCTVNGVLQNIYKRFDNKCYIWGKYAETPKQATDTTKAENGKPAVSSLLELGSDGEAGSVSCSQSCVILTTQTRCLMTGRNTTHTGSQCPKNSTVIISLNWRWLN